MTNSATKPRLLVLHPALAPYRIDFFNTLAKHFDSTICFYSKNLDDNKFGYDSVLGQIKFKPVFISESFKQLSTLKKLKVANSLYWKVKPQTVLVTETGLIPLLFVLLKVLFRQKFRLVSIIDDSYNMVAENNQFSKGHEIGERMLVPMFDETIHVEPRVAEYFQRKWQKGVCFPIIQDERRLRPLFYKALPQANLLTGQYKLQGCKVLLFVGRLINLKQPDLAIAAFRKVAGVRDRFVIVGDGPMRNMLQEQAKNDHRIILVGRKEGNELYAWYGLASVLILPSKQEAFGAVTNEALVSGCRAIVSAHAGSACLVKTGGNGVVVIPEDESGLQSAIRTELDKCAPITLPIAQRRSLMPYTFVDKIGSVIDSLLA